MHKSRYPELLEEWDYRRNKMAPQSLLPYSHHMYYWICKKCGNQFQTRLSNRTAQGNGCPKCGRVQADIERQKPVLQVDLASNQVLREFSSGRIASKFTGVSYKGISACCTGYKKTYGGYKWRFKDAAE